MAKSYFIGIEPCQGASHLTRHELASKYRQSISVNKVNLFYDEHDWRKMAMKDVDFDRARRLRATREAFRMTQTQICRIVGIRPSTWNNWEMKGLRPGLDEALKLARILALSLDCIYLGILAGVPLDIAQRLRESYLRIRDQPNPRLK